MRSTVPIVRTRRLYHQSGSSPDSFNYGADTAGSATSRPTERDGPVSKLSHGAKGTDMKVNNVLSNGPFFADDGYADTTTYTNTAWRAQTVGYGFFGPNPSMIRLSPVHLFGALCYGANSSIANDFPGGSCGQPGTGSQRQFRLRSAAAFQPQIFDSTRRRISSNPQQPAVHTGDQSRGTASRVDIGLLTVSPFYTVGGSSSWTWKPLRVPDRIGRLRCLGQIHLGSGQDDHAEP